MAKANSKSSTFVLQARYLHDDPILGIVRGSRADAERIAEAIERDGTAGDLAAANNPNGDFGSLDDLIEVRVVESPDLTSFTER